MFSCTVTIMTPLFRTSALCQVAAQGSDLRSHAQIPRDKHRPPPVGWLQPPSCPSALSIWISWSSAGHALRTRLHLPGCRSRHSVIVRSGSLVCPTYSPANCGLSALTCTGLYGRALVSPSHGDENGPNTPSLSC